MIDESKREQVLQQLDAVHAGHLQIGQREIESAIFGKLDRRFAGRRGRYVVALARENHLQNFPLRLFVVNYQYAFSRHCFSLCTAEVAEKLRPLIAAFSPSAIVGSMIVNVVPLPCLDLTLIVPP